MMLYYPELRTLTTTTTIKGKEPVHTEEPLYCGEAIHNYVMTLRSYKQGTLTLQEAFTALLLQSQNENLVMYQLEEALEETFGEGSSVLLNEAYINKVVPDKRCKHNAHLQQDSLGVRLTKYK